MGQTPPARRRRRMLFVLVPLLIAVPVVALLHPWTRRVIEVTPLSQRVRPPPPGSESVDGTTLTLNGAGIRWALNWEAYAIGLYLPVPTRDVSRVLEGSGPARLVLWIRRPLEKVIIERAFRAGVARAAGREAQRIEDELRPFFEMLRDVTKDERLVLTWRRGAGLTAELGATSATVPGEEAARAVFGIWLGEEPVDPVLRAELLAGGP